MEYDSSMKEAAISLSRGNPSVVKHLILLQRRVTSCARSPDAIMLLPYVTCRDAGSIDWN